MRYIIFIWLLFFMLSCQEQSLKDVDIRLLDTKKGSELNQTSKSTEVNNSNSKIISEKKDENESQQVVEINNSKSITLSMEKNDSIIESNESIVIPIAKNSTKTNEVELAKIEADAKAETLAMRSQHNISLKKLEAEKAKLLKEKEVALAKLESDKEIEKVKESNKKELSLLELKSQEKMVLAKLETQKNILKEQKELDKIKSLNDKEIALAKIRTQKDISKNEEKMVINKTVSDKEIAIAKLENERELVDKNIAFYQMIAMMVVGVIVLALLILYFISSRKRKNELKIHQDELRHKEYMEASRQHNAHIGKMLDVITDENADKGVKKEIVRLLKDQGKKGNLIEYKR